ncbi:MAG: DUF2017 domain-containing protein [Actinomycetota bacterium]|nr:DUF2017 domain-containing protein [Actinomycetota bacterium]
MRVSGGRDEPLTLAFEAHEVGLLRQLVDETRMLLEKEIPREDPVIARLFPEASDDADEARAYEDMVGRELRKEKLRALSEVEQSLPEDGAGEVTITGDLASAWLAWMNDVRLAVGTRLGVTEESMAAEVDPESPDGPAFSVLHWLGWIQESIIERVPPQPGDDGEAEEEAGEAEGKGEEETQ